MTLIVGIKCSDGVVLGADSAQTTAGWLQQSAKKLEIIDGRLIIGSAGHTTVAHQFRWAIENAITSGSLLTTSLMEATNSLADAMRPVIQRNWADWAFLRQHSGQAGTMPDPFTDSLVTLPVGNEAKLLVFDAAPSAFEITHDMTFGSLGSGNIAANPFLGFLRRIWWANRRPDVAEGVLATVWALSHSIEVCAGGVADPKQVITLTRTDETWLARECAQSELDEHHQVIQELEHKLAKELHDYFTEQAKPSPEPEPPQSCTP